MLKRFTFRIAIISLTRDIHKLVDELFEDFCATKNEQERKLRHQLSIYLKFYFLPSDWIQIMQNEELVSAILVKTTLSKKNYIPYKFTNKLFRLTKTYQSISRNTFYKIQLKHCQDSHHSPLF